MTDIYVTREDIMDEVDSGSEVMFMYSADGYDYFLINDETLVYTEESNPIFGVRY